MVNFVYLVGDRETGEALIIDPAYGVRELVEIAGADGLEITGALVTHYHPDHVGGSMMGWEIEGVAALLGLVGVNAPIHVNREEARGVMMVTGIFIVLFTLIADVLYAKLDPNRETVVYCQSGVRAAETAAVLKDLGFKNVKVYDSSWLGYSSTPDAPAQ